MADAKVRAELRADLAAEQESIDALVAGLDDAAWDRPSPAEGWSVKDQISHLASVDEWAITAASDPAAFTAWVAGLGPDPDGEAVVNQPVERARAMAGLLVQGCHCRRPTWTERWRHYRRVHPSPCCGSSGQQPGWPLRLEKSACQPALLRGGCLRERAGRYQPPAANRHHYGLQNHH